MVFSLRSRAAGDGHGDDQGDARMADRGGQPEPPRRPRAEQQVRDAAAARTRPRDAGEPVTRSTSRPTAVDCTKVPLAETIWPAKYQRKGRDRRARKTLSRMAGRTRHMAAAEFSLTRTEM